MMVKDLRGFVRDPMQWTQMVIMLGLLLLYAANLRRLPLDLSSESMRAVVSFLNLVTISLIMATFTSRFVFPLLSLESQQLWLLGLLPEGRFRILVVKFAFSVTITSLTGLLVMGLATRALGIPPQLAFTQLMVILATCIGLSGLSVGLGARFPVLGQRNPARIASGFGGTVNLIASIVFVSLVMGSVAVAGLLRLGSQFAFYAENPHGYVDHAAVDGLCHCCGGGKPLDRWPGTSRSWSTDAQSMCQCGQDGSVPPQPNRSAGPRSLGRPSLLQPGQPHAVSTRRLALTRSADWFLSRDWCGDGFCLSFQGYGRGVWSVIRQRMLVQSGGDDKVKER